MYSVIIIVIIIDRRAMMMIPTRIEDAVEGRQGAPNPDVSELHSEYVVRRRTE